MEYGMEFPLTPLTSSAGRLYMDLKENIVSSQLNIEKKIVMGSFMPTVKTGVYIEDKKRSFSARKLGYIYSNVYTRNREIEFLPVEEMFADANMNTTTGITLAEETGKSDSYDAENKMMAAYLAFNMPITNRINVYTGARIENNSQTLDSYDRFQQPISINNKKLNIFPSVNVTYNISSRTLIRGAYGKSINRPEFREIAPFPYYDFDQNAVYSGNPDLENALIDNFDLRFEFYPTQYETFSVGLFYKKFENPIEIKFINTGSGLEYSYKNAASANNYGIEADIRKSLSNVNAFRNITVVFNGAFIRSKVKFENGDPERNRPMAGQSPFIINAGVFYNSAKENGTDFSVLYNVIGKRLHIVGIPNSLVWEDIPDVYEMPRHVIDITVSKKLGKHWEIKGGIKDILNQYVLYQQNIDYDVDMSNYGDSPESVQHFSRKQVIRKFRPGNLFSMALTFKF
jgi:outer membrane receptor protein involved in Fe transport